MIFRKHAEYDLSHPVVVVRSDGAPFIGYNLIDAVRNARTGEGLGSIMDISLTDEQRESFNQALRLGIAFEQVATAFNDLAVSAGAITMAPLAHAPKPTFHDLLRQMGETHDTKNKDYAASSDPFKNFRQSEEVGVPAHIGAFIRLGDKFMRSNNLLKRDWQNGEGPVVKDESVQDTLMDLAVYSLLVWLLYEERKGR